MCCVSRNVYYRHVFFTRGQYLPYCDSKYSYIHTRSVLLVQCLEVQPSEKLPATGKVISDCLIWWDSLIGSGETPPPHPEAIARSCNKVLQSHHFRKDVVLSCRHSPHQGNWEEGGTSLFAASEDPLCRW